MRSTISLACLLWLAVALCHGAEAPTSTDEAADLDALKQFPRTTAVRAAAKAGNVERVEELLRTNPAWVESPDLEGDTLLHVAANQGNRPLGQLLIARDANVDAKNKTSHAPLHLAALNGRADVAALLLTNRAELLHQCVNGMTPLHEACGQGHTSVVETLLAHGAPVNAPTRDSDTPLHLAAQKGHLEVARFLLAKGASVNATNKVGETPLHQAAARGDQDVVKLLLANHADAVKRNAQLKLPLETASENSHEDVARLLRLHLAEVPARNPDKRLSVAVLPFHDGTGNAEDAFWRYSIPGMFTKSLSEIRSIRVLPPSAARYGFRELGVQVGDALTAEQARQIGELIEARRVIWGGYRRVGSLWQVSGRLMNVATGKSSREFSAASTNWHDLRDQLLDQALGELQIMPSPVERAKMRRRKTNSSEALAWYSRAFAAFEEPKPFAESEAYARQALAADPEIEGGYRVLAVSLASQGKLTEAEPIIRALLKVEPNNAGAHQILGAMLIIQNKPAAAEQEVREALRLDPEDPETYSRMGELHAVRKRWEAALYYWTESKRRDPTDARIRASLARGHAMTRDRTQALNELKEVERLHPEDPGAAQFVPQVYETLGEVPQAVEHYEKFVKLARSLGLNPEMTGEMAAHGEELKLRLAATPVQAPMPKEYSIGELEQLLRARLTPAELKMVVNPLASTPEMRQWALELTRDALDDLAKARAIFDEMIHRIQTKVEGRARTAQEVFAAWRRPEENFYCNELAKLYVALARDARLKAFYVHLEEDCQGRIVYHDCAIVFVEGQALLVDPAYRWFGVPHRQFVVLDDAQAVAHQLLQPSGGDDDVVRDRAGVKLHPDHPWAHLQRARGLLDNNQLVEAEQALAVVQRLEPDRWDWFIVNGVLEAKRRRFETARQRLEEGLKRNPDDGLGHFWMAAVLREQGKLAEARDQFRAALRCFLKPQHEKAATRALAQLNELIGSE